ncbi:MAG TPA: class I SAM-dependent methyltransferase [Vicinamibacteria bacterium]|nr:class I SAM-dependent methyltransferase [Vicinamibacteria bacterium]
MAADAVLAPDVETASEGYARRFAGPVGAWFLDVQARLALELLRPWPGARVLDVGGGHGQLTGALVGAGHDVTVFGSPGACGERLRPWLESARVSYEAGDLLRAPWPDRAFDAVVSFRLLPHLPDWPALVRELCRLAARAVVIDYPTRRSVNAASEALFGLKKAVEGDTRPFTVFRDRDVRRALLASGFQVTARRPEFFFPMALHRALGAAAATRALEEAARLSRLTRLLGSPVVLRAERHGT